MHTILLAAAMTAALTAPDAVLDRFMAAWSASDAKGIATLFESDADFVSPDGYKASGRSAIERFYASAFARGYAGSHGAGEIVTTRAIAPDLVLIDGRWSIDRAAHPLERGILSALLRRDGDGWHIVMLRENAGATTFLDFPPKS